MYVHKRQKKDGSTSYSFTFFDETGKRVRLKKSSHPEFTEYEDAKEWAKTQTAVLASKRAYHERKLSWRNDYHDFELLLDTYANWQKTRAPNSWKSCVYYLEHWVFPFFLNEKKVGNINDWHLFFQEFQDWLTSNPNLKFSLPDFFVSAYC